MRVLFTSKLGGSSQNLGEEVWLVMEEIGKEVKEGVKEEESGGNGGSGGPQLGREVPLDPSSGPMGSLDIN